METNLDAMEANLSEADILRRGMSGKYRSRSEFLAVKEKFFSKELLVKENFI